MKVLIVDTYYPAFIASIYRTIAGLSSSDYRTQIETLLDQCFGTSDFYSRHLNAVGVQASDIIVNSVPLQSTWAAAAGRRFMRLSLRIPSRARRMPLAGHLFRLFPGLLDIAVEQVQALRPDVLYCQDLSFFPPETLAKLRLKVGIVVGQIACPLPPAPFLKGYDLILTSFPHFVPRLRAMGVASEYFRIGFDTRVLELLGPVKKDIDASFVGGISRHHGKAIPILEYLAKTTPIQFYGYGARTLDPHSPIRARHHGEVWGMDMYRALARSRVTLNRHIDVAENNANNMRLYEATGVGTLLITDRKDNLHELFDVGRELLTYSTPREAAEIIQYYLDHPTEAEVIAKAGQARTLREHTYRRRMEELVPILERHLGARHAR